MSALFHIPPPVFVCYVGIAVMVFMIFLYTREDTKQPPETADKE